MPAASAVGKRHLFAITETMTNPIDSWNDFVANAPDYATFIGGFSDDFICTPIAYAIAGGLTASADRCVNRETLFFRHMASYAALSDELLPVIGAQRVRQGENRIALWSAGCSSGEEPYSMAIAAKEAPPPGCFQFDVLGSDLSGEALAMARRAVYGPRSVAEMPETFRRRYLVCHESGYEVNAAIRAMVRFEQCNLSDPSTYPAAPQDVIFCQNVFIYFREAMRVQVAAGFARCLRPGGFLVPAPGDLIGLTLPGLKWLRLRNTMVLQRGG